MFTTKRSALVLSRLLLMVFASLAAACGDPSGALRPAAPAPDTSRAVKPLPGPPFAEPSRAATIYRGPDNLYSNYVDYHRGLLASRYVFYEDSTFALQFSSPRFGLFEYNGRYSRTDSKIELSFFDSNTAGPWDATAALNGGEMSVTYNVVMSLADFVDGVYVQSR
jgi:hypothetical protein